MLGGGRRRCSKAPVTSKENALREAGLCPDSEASERGAIRAGGPNWTFKVAVGLDPASPVHAFPSRSDNSIWSETLLYVLLLHDQLHRFLCLVRV